MPHRTEAGGKERPYPGKRNREQKPSIDRCFPGKKPLIEKVTQDTKNPISKLSKTKAILPCNINYAKAAHEIKGHNTKKINTLLSITRYINAHTLSRTLY